MSIHVFDLDDCIFVNSDGTTMKPGVGKQNHETNIYIYILSNDLILEKAIFSIILFVGPLVKIQPIKSHHFPLNSPGRHASSMEFGCILYHKLQWETRLCLRKKLERSSNTSEIKQVSRRTEDILWGKIMLVFVGRYLGLQPYGSYDSLSLYFELVIDPTLCEWFWDALRKSLSFLQPVTKGWWELGDEWCTKSVSTFFGMQRLRSYCQVTFHYPRCWQADNLES